MSIQIVLTLIEFIQSCKSKGIKLNHLVKTNPSDHNTSFFSENKNLYTVLSLFTQPAHYTILSKIISSVAEESGTEDVDLRKAEWEKK